MRVVKHSARVLKIASAVHQKTFVEGVLPEKKIMPLSDEREQHFLRTEYLILPPPPPPHHVSYGPSLTDTDRSAANNSNFKGER